MNSQDKPVLLLSVGNILTAREIQRTLEEHDIFTSIQSDNPASSVMNVGTGMNVIETVHVMIMEKEFERAVEILSGTQYAEYFEDPPDESQ